MEYEGIHFLAALNDETNQSDDNVSWNSSFSNEEEEEKCSSPPAKKFRAADVNWETEEINTLNPMPFTGDSGFKFTLENSQPIDFFNFFCKQEFLLEIRTCTNAYGKELHSLKDNSFGSWKMLTISELYVFLGLVYHTGTIRMNNISDYWSIHKLFDLKIFRTSMSKNRFLRILTALRFSNAAVFSSANESKADSVEPLITYFNNIMIAVCSPGRELVIDNCLAVTDGTIVPKESLNTAFSKPDMFLHSLSEPSGLVHKVVLSEFMAAHDVVFSLMEGRTERGHSLFLDRHYCTVPLVLEMISKRTYCTGILDRRNVPNVCIGKVEKGSSSVKFCEPGVCLVQWRGREEVFAVSSEFRGYLENRVEADCKLRPLMIREYKKTVREVERKEFDESYQPLGAKNLSWYRAIGIHILQLMMKNSYLLYNNHVKKMTYHDFRLSVIEGLLQRASEKLELVSPNVPIVSDDELHVPKKFPKREGQRSLRKRCRVCLWNGKRTDSYYHCPKCPALPALCLEGCFAEYHSNKNTQIDPLETSSQNAKCDE